MNILKCLAGSKWGQDKETIVTTHKTIVRSTLEYAAPIWAPIISKTSVQKLQNVQNQALRLATGNLRMAHTDHIHRETKVLPVQQHTNLITKQFVANFFLPGHPGAKHLGRPPEPRKMKNSALSHTNELRNKLPNGFIDMKAIKTVQKSVHTDTVKNTLDSYTVNRVLAINPPEINNNEAKLSRETRTELSRLRSGFSRKLNSYMSRIDPTIEDKCPQCSSTPHDTTHLFNCPANPSQMNVLSLWTDPVKAANFLKLSAENDDLHIREEEG